jgi:hypothetical protein
MFQILQNESKICHKCMRTQQKYKGDSSFIHRIVYTGSDQNTARARYL